MKYLDPISSSEASYIDNYRKNYICSLKAVDQAVDAVMDSLGPELDNTLIIFTSDNGYFFGEHRKEGKWELYEEGLRVPFAIRYPPLINGPQVRDEFVSNVDIVSTVVDLTGANPTIKIDGRSLADLFISGSPSWRTHLLVEQIRHGNQTGVRTDGYHYIESRKSGTTYYELYDMVKDPYQLENVASKSAYSTIRNQLHNILIDLKND
jgi:arylsulfatase A-like enzyme